ncbi:MAG TPA: GspH/FimT family pseudopilin [Thiohalobacter sp.]|nr:GspH/FimT family pseudopilin [Thiohalobacter sp.]
MKKKTQGFTLIELLVTLAIMAILLTVGVPSFRDFIMNNRITTQANEFVASIQTARSLAIRHQRPAQICVSANPAAATPACTASTDWTQGWFVWVDLDRDSTIDNNEVMRVTQALAGTTTFDSTTRNAFTYDPRGLVDNGDTLDLCDDRANETGRRITISAVGRVNIAPFNSCP